MRANLLPFEALAAAPPIHGGHGTTESSSSLLHFLLEPAHLPLTIIAGLLVGAAVWYFWSKRILKRSR
jgi:hypothetical protein